MTYFTSPSGLAYALLFAGLAISLASVSAAINTVTFRPGSPAAIADRTAFRVAGYVGAALLVVGAAPILFAPVRTLLKFAGI